MSVDQQVLDDAETRAGVSVFVYQWPVRLWHWINATAITVLCLTGYFIGSPLPTMPGEASAHFLMGYIRFAHFTAGYILAVGLIGRIYWAIVGNHHARELFTLPVFSLAYWKEVITMPHMPRWCQVCTSWLWPISGMTQPNRWLAQESMPRPSPYMAKPVAIMNSVNRK